MEEYFRDVFNRQFFVTNANAGDNTTFFAELDSPVSLEIENIRWGDATQNTGQYNDLYINFKEPHKWDDAADAWFELKDFDNNADRMFTAEVNVVDRFSEGTTRYIRTDNPHRLSNGSRFRIFNFDDGEGNGQ
jgi:hypothetical protein